jgi:competence protein ComEA
MENIIEKFVDYQEGSNEINFSQRIKNLKTSEIIGFTGLGLLALAIISFLIVSSKSDSDIEILSQEDFDAENNSKVIFVDVSGAVQKPGLYQLNSHSRVNDALVAAGGLSLSADREWLAKNLNLAALLKDGQKIYIKEKSLSGGGANDQKNTQQSATSDWQFEDKININTASLAELEKLNGVGPVTAQKIVDYREKEGSFTKIEDLMKVPGIGEKTFEKFKEQITVW